MRNKHEDNLQPETEPPQPTSRPRSKKKKMLYCYMLVIFYGWLLCSIAVSIAN